MTELKTTFKTDILFKALFEKHPNLLKSLVSNLLSIPKDEITQFELRNQELPPDFIDDKYCRVDINMEVNGKRINLEVQVEDFKSYPERVLFNWARIYSNSIASGDNYSQLPQTIVISIVNFKLFKDIESFHTQFRPLEVNSNHLLSDRMVLHFFELWKVTDSINTNDRLNLWLSLFRANTVEELKSIEQLEDTEMTEAINAYNTITAEKDFQDLERRRILARMDEGQALFDAGQEGEARGKSLALQISKRLFKGESNSAIANALSITEDEVEEIRIELLGK